MIWRIKDRRRKAIVCPTCALALGACLLLTAQAPAWKEFSIGPPRRGAPTELNNVQQGVLHSNAISLTSLIGYAAGVPTGRVDGPGWMATQHFAVTAILGDATHERLRTRSPEETTIAEEFRALLTRELELRFHLEYHRQNRDTPTYTLRAAEGKRPSLVPSTDHERGKINLTTSATTHDAALSARGVTFETIGAWLQGYLRETVTVDPSLPDTVYDIHLKWQAHDRASLVAALKDQLGLELREETNSLEYVVVDQVERPNRAAAPAPVAAVPASRDSAVSFTPAELRKDLRVLREALEEGDPGIYRYTPKAAMDSAFDGAATGFDRSMTALEFYRALAPVVARIKCGQAVLRPSRGIQQRVAAEPLIPFEAAVLGGKVYVARDFSEGGGLAGAEIVSINEVTIGQILASMLAVVHGDGDSAMAGPYQLSHDRGFARNLYLIAGLQSPFRVTYSLGGGSGETSLAGMTLNSMREVEDSRYLRTAEPGNAAWRLLDGGAVGVLTIRSFEGNAEDGTPLGVFFDRVFTELREKKVSKLILDLRDNGGGESQLGLELYTHFADQPFRYYRDPIGNKLSSRLLKYVPSREPLPARAREAGVQQPAASHFGGKLVALMNGGSFSTACEFLAMLHNHGGATFAGEETAGGYYGGTPGTEAQVVLPNSKLIMPVPLAGHYLAIDGDAQGAHGIRPDYPVEYSIGDILAGRDRAMEAALRLAAK